MNKKQTRNYSVSARIKRKGLRKIAVIRITDGNQELIFETVGGFELQTDQPISKPLLRQYT